MYVLEPENRVEITYVESRLLYVKSLDTSKKHQLSPTVETDS